MNLTLEDALRAQIARISESAMRERERYEAQIAAMTRTMMDWDQLRTNPVITINTNTLDADVLRARLDAIEDGRSVSRAVLLDSSESAPVDLLMKREPTTEEMEACLGDLDEIPVGARIPYGWPTIRRCRHCRTPVAGGPTACIICVRTRESKARAENAESVLHDAIESGRVVVSVVIDKYSREPFAAVPVEIPPAAMTVALTDDGPPAVDVELVAALLTMWRVVAAWVEREKPSGVGFKVNLPEFFDELRHVNKLVAERRERAARNAIAQEAT